MTEPVFQGQQVGEWTLIKEAEKKRTPGGQKKKTWLCRCSCGVERVVVADALRRRMTKSCGEGDHDRLLAGLPPVEGTLECEVEGCTRRARSRFRGPCEMHYYRVRRDGEIGQVESLTPRYDGPTCTVEGCDNPRQGKMCPKHTARMVRHGDPHHVEPGSRDNPKPVESYRLAHKQVKRLRGPASQYACVDCGGAAQEWSYDHADPNERYEFLTWKDKVYELAWSPDPDRYQSRCIRCHRLHDGNPIATGAYQRTVGAH